MVFCYCLFFAFFLISAFRRMGDCKGRTIRKLMGGGRGRGVDPAQLLLRYINQAELPFLICERTEALSVMVFVLEQKLSTIVWTPIQLWLSTFEMCPAQLCCVTEIEPKSPFLCMNRRPIREYSLKRWHSVFITKKVRKLNGWNFVTGTYKRIRDSIMKRDFKIVIALPCFSQLYN